mmetsp:Transcript_1944/g.4179  ORF Transcript_1944/g.4179 Transcript_1944/m.4179 type:complete len:110 (-) Transcript_1944:3448-3777(-)
MTSQISTIPQSRDYHKELGMDNKHSMSMKVRCALVKWHTGIIPNFKPKTPLLNFMNFKKNRVQRNIHFPADEINIYSRKHLEPSSLYHITSFKLNSFAISPQTFYIHHN